MTLILDHSSLPRCSFEFTCENQGTSKANHYMFGFESAQLFQKDSTGITHGACSVLGSTNLSIAMSSGRASRRIAHSLTGGASAGSRTLTEVLMKSTWSQA